MRFCLVSGGIVTQAIELDPRWQEVGQPWFWSPPLGVQVIQSDTAGAGWTWNGSQFTAPPPNPTPPPTPGEERIELFASLPERQDIIQRLKTATPAQIDAWLLANVTNLTQARTVLGMIIKVLAARPPD